LKPYSNTRGKPRGTDSFYCFVPLPGVVVDVEHLGVRWASSVVPSSHNTCTSLLDRLMVDVAAFEEMSRSALNRGEVGPSGSSLVFLTWYVMLVTSPSVSAL
jgi:hypothetical protein